MKLKYNFLTILVIVLTSTFFIFSACENKDDDPANKAPTCNITSPSDGDEFTQGATITIAVEAEDEDNNLDEVRFYVNNTGISSAGSFPYNFEWDTSEEEPGSFTIKAEAIDEAQEKTSDEINITLDEAGSAPTAAFISDTDNITEGETVNFEDQSDGDPDSWQWDFGDDNTSAEQNPTHTYNSEGNYTVSLTVENDFGSDTATKTDYITVEGFDWATDTVTEVVEVTNPGTGKTWMDRNLGATRAATDITDNDAYGDLYQWGRAADGHEYRWSTTTSFLNGSDTPGHGDFILATTQPYDWRCPQSDNLWQGIRGTNKPCPGVYRLPTEAELDAERETWSSNDASGAFNSPLKLSLAGGREHDDGSIGGEGTHGYYWTSNVDGTGSRLLFFNSTNANMSSYHRATGLSVRCIKE